MPQKPDLARDDRGALAQLRGDVVVGAERVGAVPRRVVRGVVRGVHAAAKNVLDDVATAGAERMVSGRRRMVASERHRGALYGITGFVVVLRRRALAAGVKPPLDLFLV